MGQVKGTGNDTHRSPKILIKKKKLFPWETRVYTLGLGET